MCFFYHKEILKIYDHERNVCCVIYGIVCEFSFHLIIHPLTIYFNYFVVIIVLIGIGKFHILFLYTYSRKIKKKEVYLFLCAIFSGQKTAEQETQFFYSLSLAIFLKNFGMFFFLCLKKEN
jgi:hypothetical protein